MLTETGPERLADLLAQLDSDLERTPEAPAR